LPRSTARRSSRSASRASRAVPAASRQSTIRW
jgi:hypothetical protein